MKQNNKEKVAGLPQQREPVTAGQKSKKYIRIIKTHNHKIKSNTRQAG